MKNFREILDEGSAMGVDSPFIPSISSKEPPNIIILQRKNIRQMSNGQKVALYYAAKINKYVTIPFSDTGISEEIEIEEDEMFKESVIHHLNDIVTNGAKRLKFKDGTSAKVDASTAHAILTVHSGLNRDNQDKLADMARKSKSHFLKVADFAWKNVSYK